MKKITKFKNMINSPNLEFIMEAHNGLSARIVEEIGFKGIWASGLSISAALGVRDNNEASWTQILEVCEFMSDNTNITILLDGDTGFGNFNNFRRLVRKLEERGIGGVCIEDKLFPKTNSFIGGERQPLADMEEFCGKIKAGKDYQNDPDFVIIARIEAFIAGWGLDEAIKRANAFADAGADAILVHSKISTDKDIESFMQKWDNRKPIVIVPTMYYKTPTKKFKDMGISLVIWANHTLRASITSMQKNVKKIYKDESLINIENEIVPVKEIFRLQNVQEYKQAELKYLPQKTYYKGLILAASKGENFGSLVEDKPKAMITIGDDTILSKIVKTFNSQGIKDISVVVGYKRESVDLPNLKYIENDKYNKYGLLYSIYKSKKVFDGNVIISFGDILFEEDLLNKIISSKEDIVLTVDVTGISDKKRERDMVKGKENFNEKFGISNISELVQIDEVQQNENMNDYDGEWIGLLKLNSKGSAIFKKELELLEKENLQFLQSESVNDFINHLISKKYKIHIEYFRGQWKDIDSIEDIAYLVELFSKKSKE